MAGDEEETHATGGINLTPSVIVRGYDTKECCVETRNSIGAAELTTLVHGIVRLMRVSLSYH